MADGRALVQHDDARVLELLNHGARGVARRLYDLDSLLDNHARVGSVVGGDESGEKRDVHGEGLRGQGAAAPDLGAEVLRSGEDERRDNS